MIMSESDTRDLAEVKKDLEDRAEKAERDLRNLRIMIKLIDEALTKVSFKPASKLMAPQVEAAPTKRDAAATSAQWDAAKPVAGQLPPQTAAAKLPERAFVTPAAEMAPVQKPSTPPQAPSKPSEASEQEFPIKSKNGDDLGALYIGQYSVRIVPQASLRLSAKTPPFQSFFIDRVIGEMRRKDEMAVDAGSKDPMSIIDHEVVLEGEFLKEIRITNIDEDARVRELRSSIRWTFERMMEKRTV